MTLRLEPVKVPVSKEDRQRMIEPPQINGSSGLDYTTLIDSNFPGVTWWTRLVGDPENYREGVTLGWLSGFWRQGHRNKKNGQIGRDVLEEGHVIILACGQIGSVPECIAFRVVLE